MTAANEYLNILFPPGRMVWGDLYTPRTTDQNGQPLLIKNGPNKGQPRADFGFGVAIPKTPGVTHWANEVHADPKIGDWGARIWAFMHGAWPQGQAQRPDFASKITDGDSAIPNKAGKKPCEKEGYPGHWVITFSGSKAPKIVTKDGSAVILEKDAVKCGYYVQVYGSVASNKSDQSPGVYMNHSLVAMAGYGAEISSGPDAASVGFGSAPPPPGASAVPLGGMTPPANGAPPAPPGAPSAAPAAVSPPVPAAAANPPPPPAVAPAVATAVPTPPANAGFVAGPGTPPPPSVAAAAPPPPSAAPAKQMTPAATTTYDEYIKGGWTDAQLIANGLMLP